MCRSHALQQSCGVVKHSMVRVVWQTGTTKWSWMVSRKPGIWGQQGSWFALRKAVWNACLIDTNLGTKQQIKTSPFQSLLNYAEVRYWSLYHLKAPWLNTDWRRKTGKVQVCITSITCLVCALYQPECVLCCAMSPPCLCEIKWINEKQYYFLSKRKKTFYRQISNALTPF